MRFRDRPGKRHLSLRALLLALALTVAACGGGGVGEGAEGELEAGATGTGPDTAGTEPAPETPLAGTGTETEDTATEAADAGGDATICVMPKLIGIPYFDASQQGAEEAAEELGVTLNYNGPTEAQAEEQVQMIQQWIDQDCDAISVAANDPDALAPAMKDAAAAGIATSAWDADVAKDARDVFVNQATFQAIGQQLVDIMAEMTDGQGDFMVVTGSLTAPNQNAWIDEMRSYMESDYPDMQIAEILPGEEDLARGIEVTRTYLQANPDTAGVFGLTTVALPGVAEAVQQLGVADQVAVTGLSTPSQMEPYVPDPVEQFVLWNPVDLGYLAVHVANAQVSGTLPESGTFEAGRLGQVEVVPAEDGESPGGPPDEVLLGPPLVFTEDNIGDFSF